MRAATAYFAGVGTVAIAVAAGLGGGLLLGDIMSPQQPKHPSSEVTRLEQRSPPQPIPAANGAAQPVPYMGATQITNTVAGPQRQPQLQQAPTQEAQPQQQSQQAQSPQPKQPQSQQAQPRVQQASTRSTEAKPPEESKQVEQKPVEQRTPAQATAVAAPPPAGAEQRAGPEDSLARARDSDVKRDDRRADEKRKYERRKWSDKRKWRQRDDDDLRDVEASVREDTEGRPGRYGSPFGSHDSRIDHGEQRPVFIREPGFTRSLSLFDD